MNWKVIIAQFIPTGIVIPILKGHLRNCKWIVGAAAGEGKGLSILLNHSEPEQLDMAKNLTNKDIVCFDIGANVGLYTLLLAKYSKYVFAFEPMPRNLGYLSRILEINSIKNATIVPCAISQTTGLSSFQAGSNCAIGKLDPQGNQPVTTISCDDFISQYKTIPGLIKIDVEGAELEVLRGASNLLKNQKPIILLSTHGETERINCLEYLKNFNYSEFIPLNHGDINQASEFAIIP